MIYVYFLILSFSTSTLSYQPHSSPQLNKINYDGIIINLDN